MVAPAPKPEVLVVGAGVIGLTTAAVLCERGHRVRLWSRDEPAQTTSAVAAALWYPFLAEPRARVLGWSAVTFRRLAALATDPASGVCMQRTVEWFATAAPDLWWADAVGGGRWLPAADVPPPYRAAFEIEVPVCATPVYLPWLVARLRSAGVAITVRNLRSLDEALEHAPVVVNCTGLGARELCGDTAMQAVRGQVVVVDRVPGVDAMLDETGAQPFYVIPRGDELVLGGTAQHGDERREPDPRDTAAILAGIAARVPALQAPRIRAVRVGLRPYRRTVRLEAVPRRDGRLLVHNHGHGGSGFTLAWGCATEVADLVDAFAG